MLHEVARFPHCLHIHWCLVVSSFSSSFLVFILGSICSLLVPLFLNVFSLHFQCYAVIWFLLGLLLFFFLSIISFFSGGTSASFSLTPICSPFVNCCSVVVPWFNKCCFHVYSISCLTSIKLTVSCFVCFFLFISFLHSASKHSFVFLICYCFLCYCGCSILIHCSLLFSCSSV